MELSLKMHGLVRLRNCFWALMSSLILISMASDAMAVSKVARSFNFVDFFAGSSMPVGNRHGLPDYDFLINNRPVKVNSEDIYGNTFHLGITYGQFRGNNLLWSAGFRYTKNDVFDTIPLTNTIISVDTFNTSYNQFDIDFNLNYLLTDIAKSSFSPYGGIGFQAGIISISQDGYSTDYSANLGLSLNFGADLKIWNAVDNLSFVTLSSVNSYDLLGSSDRPKYLNIGGAIKYYFRP